ncbi:MAG: hypothetical protein ABI224_13940, partial [Acetobacteraceae bacterium]
MTLEILQRDRSLPLREADSDDLCAPAPPAHLQDMVDAPCRALNLEYKSWRNLDNPEDAAELARDIAAIANDGGGAIAFGFNEDTLAPTDTEPFATVCEAAKVAAIAAAYLDPTPRCEVAIIRSAIGDDHPVIRIPGHGASPVFIRRDGPTVNGERLIERGTVYIRRHGVARRGTVGAPRPESARMEGPWDWAPLLRRCVRQDRQTLLGLIDAAIEGRRDAPDLTERLRLWHDAAHEAFRALVPRSPVADSLGPRHYALSYAFELNRPEMLEPVQLPEFLSRCVFSVQDLIRIGTRMFDPPYRRAVRGRFVADAATGDEDTDFLETAWLRDVAPSEMADFWRVSPRGLASVVRAYGEDQRELNASLGMEPGTWFSPNALAREVAELVCHARAFARFFGSARTVMFRCEWWGLSGRVLFDPAARWVQSGASLVSHRIVTQEVPVATLAKNWPEVVAHLMAPLLRAIEQDLALGT